MKEELISFETAKLAKEKGFDVEGHQYYYDSPESVLWHSIKMEMHNKSENISVETQSLLQKWLREEHDVHIILNPYREFIDGEITGYWLGDIYTSKETLREDNDDNFSTYEEALEKGLIAALKCL